MIQEDVTDVLNGPIRKLDDQSTLFRLSRDADQLVKWAKVLPPELSYSHTEDPDCEPGVFNMQMHFFVTLILLHRPFAGYRLSLRNAAHGNSTHLLGYPPALSQKICYQNAVRITKTLLRFESTHGINKMFTVMVYLSSIAASTLIFDIFTNGPTGRCKEAKFWLGKCLSIVESLKSVFPITCRVRAVLDTFLHYCGLAEFTTQHGSNSIATTHTNSPDDGSADQLRSNDTQQFLTGLVEKSVENMYLVPPFQDATSGQNTSDAFYETRDWWEM